MEIFIIVNKDGVNLGKMQIRPNLVSVIIPVYNRSEMLKEAVESVLAQTYRPIEVIIVDDGSTDNTQHICQDYVKRYPKMIKVIYKQHQGRAGLAREVGRQIAQGEFIQYLDSDDLLMPKKFEVMVRALKENGDCDVAYCYTRRYKIGEIPKDIPWRKTGVTIDRMFPNFLKERFWHTITPLYCRTVCDRAGSWTDLLCEEDWEYDCRIAIYSRGLYHCKEFLADARDHTANRITKGNFSESQILKERYRALRMIYTHAKNFGITFEDPNMQRFARYLFLVARLCGKLGLTQESKECFEMAKEASGFIRAKGIDFRYYERLAHIIGWTNIGKLSCFLDRLRIIKT